VDLEGNSAELPSFRWSAALAEEVLVHFSGIFEGSLPCSSPLCAHPRAASRELHPEATALMFSSSTTDDWVRLVGANELFA